MTSRIDHMFDLEGGLDLLVENCKGWFIVRSYRTTNSGGWYDESAW